jgi:hypothetical protein
MVVGDATHVRHPRLAEALHWPTDVISRPQLRGERRVDAIDGKLDDAKLR